MIAIRYHSKLPLMSQVLIREIDSKVIDRLRGRARQHGRSLEAELRQVLWEAAGLEKEEALKEVRKLQAMFAGRTFTDSAMLIREDRDR